MTEVYTADEAFTTGTMGGLAPVLEVDGRRIGGRDARFPSRSACSRPMPSGRSRMARPSSEWNAGLGADPVLVTERSP